MVKVSIILPVYNSEKYLDECMQSIIKQSLVDIEIICIDDGSTDSSGKLLDDFASTDSRIKVIHKQNSGYGNAMNTGIKAATGDYIGVVESDDYIKAEMMEKLYDTALQTGADVVKCDFERFIGIRGKYNFEYASIAADDKYYKILNPSEDNTLYRSSMRTWSGIYRMEFIKQNNIKHNESPGASYQDNGFWFQVYTSTEKLYFIKEALYCLRRDNPNSSALSKNKVQCMSDEYLFIRNYLLETNKWDKYKYAYSDGKFGNYWWTFQRIHWKYKRDYFFQIERELRQAVMEGELDEPTKEKNKKILGSDPEEYWGKSFGFICKLVSEVKIGRKIVIYGAGKVGTQIVKSITNYMPDIKKYLIFAVTGIPAYTTIDDIPVVTFNQLIPKKDQLCIVIAVSFQTQNEIMQNLSAIQVVNIITRNDYMTTF